MAPSITPPPPHPHPHAHPLLHPRFPPPSFSHLPQKRPLRLDLSTSSSSSSSRRCCPDSSCLASFACLRILAFLRLPAIKSSRKLSRKSFLLQRFSTSVVDKTGRCRAREGQQNAASSNNARASTVNVEGSARNGLSYGGYISDSDEYRSEAVESDDAWTRANTPGSANFNGDSRKRHEAGNVSLSASSPVNVSMPRGDLDNFLDEDSANSPEDPFDDFISFRRLNDENISEARDRATIWHTSELEQMELREDDIRFLFLESLMERSRGGDILGVEEVIADMAAAGLKPGPRSYHGLAVVYSRAGDTEGALQALRREVNAGQQPLQETFVALVRAFAVQGQSSRGEEILAAMEKYKLDIRFAWLILVEELYKAGYLKEANEVLLKGAEGGLKATDQLFDLLVDGNAKAGDHSNAISILRHMEYGGRMCNTSHYNCLLMIEAHAGEPDIAAEKFQSMQDGNDDMKPDTESYNWMIQAHTRCKSGGDRCQNVVDLLGEMVEDHKRVQPNARTYALLVECYTKYHCVLEAVRHFRALSKVQGGTRLLYNEGKEGDPLSLYLRALCLTGRIDDLLEALQGMLKDNQPITPRAMIVNRKGRTLVSSWIEPLQQEAELGYEVDYIARYIAEGGLTGTRKRWSPSDDGKSTPLDPDDEGFIYGAPVEYSFKSHCSQTRRSYILRLLKKVKRDGLDALGPDATDADLKRVIEKLRKDVIVEPARNLRKPKAASKMLVSELKEELEAQGLPTDGTRPVLYQRVQKARRINRARGRPLWLPPRQEVVEEVDDVLEKFISRINLKNENTEYWRKRFLGEAVEEEENTDQQDAENAMDADSSKEGDSGNGDKEEDEDIAGEEADDSADDGGEEEEPEPPALLAAQLFRNTTDALEEEEWDEDDLASLTLDERIALLKSERRFDASEMYTIAEVWGWTWEKELDAQEPEKWSQEREVKLGIEVMEKVLALGGIPTIGDCAMLLRASLRTPWPEAMVNILQQSHKLGYVFGSPLYEEVVTLCLRLDEKDAAIAIVTDMEDAGISVPDEILDAILPEEFSLEEDMPS